MTFPIMILDGLVDGLVDEDDNPVMSRDSDDVGGLVDRLVDSQKRIIELVVIDPRVSKKDMANKLGISETSVDKNLMRLKQKNIIARVGNNKDGSWVLIKKPRR
tara:strand:+ start:510 stop:821 length:312 start_codon:yes stop_codon:yes gene_type:complete